MCPPLLIITFFVFNQHQVEPVCGETSQANDLYDFIPSNLTHQLLHGGGWTEMC